MISNSKSEIKIGEKLSFASVNIGNIPIMTLIGSFLLIFYVDVVGLDPIAIATLFLISKVIDGINDPITGFIIDHLPNTKWGRFRPYLIIGSLLCSLNYILLWLGPSMATTGKLIIAYVSYLLMGITFDLMDIPLNSMIPVMTTTIKDRNTMSGIKGFSYLLGGVIVTVIAIPIIERFPTARDGYHFYIVLISIFVFLLSVVGTLGIKERVSQITKEKYRLKDLYKILGTKPAITNFVANLLVNTGSACSSAMTIFFWIYVVGIPALYSVAMIVNIIGVIIGVVIAPSASNKIGKKKTILIGLTIIGIFQILILLVPSSQIELVFVFLTIIGFGSGIAMAVFYGITADVVDYIEWKQGNRTEGALASLVSFVTKAAMGIGSAMAAFILAFTHYVPNVEQTEQAIQGIYLGTFLLPGLLIIFGTISIQILYPITKDLNEKITLELLKRREFLSK